MDLAIKEKDHAFNQFMQWYVAEQVEEEDNTSMLARKLKKIGESMPAIMQIDGQLAARTLVVPIIPGTTVGTP